MSGNPFPEMQNPYQSPSIDAGAGDAAGGSSRTVDLLRQTGPWVRFLAVLGFIGSGIMIVFGVIGGLSMMAMAGGVGMIVLIVYPLMGLLYLVPAIYLNRYASNIKSYIYGPTVNRLDAALEAQKSFWKFMGILTAIILGIYALLFVFMFLGGALLMG